MIHQPIPRASGMAHFTWQPQTLLLHTYAQFTGFTPNGFYLNHYATVRSRHLARRILSVPTYNTLEDNWGTNYIGAEVIEKMPEEMYFTWRKKGGEALEYRLAPFLPDIDGSDQ